MKTQQPEQTARTSQPSAQFPATDVAAEPLNPKPLISLSVDERFLLKLLLPIILELPPPDLPEIIMQVLMFIVI